MEDIQQVLVDFVRMPAVRAVLVLAAAALVALFVGFVFARLARLVSRTKSDLDDRILGSLRVPVVWSIMLIGVGWLVVDLEPPQTVQFVVFGVIKTLGVLLWGRAAMQVGTIVLEALSCRIDRFRWIEEKTLPLLEMVLKVVVVAGVLYLGLMAWNLDVTSWLASAGIIGIAVGFAAKDTLANLFAGVFIIADAPYKIGDFVVLDQELRGKVVDIGIRSTRILTRDDIEVTVPNAVIANAQIINETGGPHQKMRVRVKIGVAYGSRVEQVCEVLLACVEGVEHVCPEPSPRVRFRSFGDSSLDFELMAWIDEPVHRGRVLHDLNTRVYDGLNAAGIEIPYPKRDVYIKEFPAR